MIYIASPYSSPFPEARQLRYEAALRFTHKCVKDGLIAYSPIVHFHPMSVKYNLPGEVKFWLYQNFGVLRHCEALFVLCLSQWEKSQGVDLEIKMATSLAIPIAYWNEDGTPRNG